LKVAFRNVSITILGLLFAPVNKLDPVTLWEL